MLAKRRKCIGQHLQRSALFPGQTDALGNRKCLAPRLQRLLRPAEIKPGMGQPLQGHGLARQIARDPLAQQHRRQLWFGSAGIPTQACDLGAVTGYQVPHAG